MTRKKRSIRRGHVRKHRGKWAVVISQGTDPQTGKRRRTWHLYATRDEAEKALTTLLKSLDDGVWVDPSKITVGEFLSEKWLPAIEHTVRPSTWERYRGIVAKHVVPRIGNAKLQKLDPATLNRLYADLLKAGLAPRSVQYCHATVRRGLAAALRWSLVARNVALLADPPRPRRPEMKTWDAEQVRAFLDAAKQHYPRLFPAFRLAFASGARRGEILGAPWSGLDLDAGTLTISRTRVAIGHRRVEWSEPKTQAGRRTITLDAETIGVLRAHRAAVLEERIALGASRPSPDESIFADLAGAPIHPGNLSQAFRRIAKRAGLPIIPLHGARHSAATLMLKAGVHPKVVQQRLGHSDIGVTLGTYSHVLPEIEAEAAEKLSRMIAGDAP